MALQVRARLSSLDDDDEDDAATTASSFSSGASTPPLSPASPAPAVILGAPRVAAQLSSTEEDASSEAFDDFTSSGEERDVVEEVSNGFFFTVARVPPPPPAEDPASVPGGESAGAAAALEGADKVDVADASLEGSFVSAESAVEGLDAVEERNGLDVAAASGIGSDDMGIGVQSSLDASFQSSRSGDLLNAFDDSGLQDGTHEAQDADAEPVNGVVLEPLMTNAGGIEGGATDLVDAMEKGGELDHDVTKLFHGLDARGKEGDNIGLCNGDSDAKDSASLHEVVRDFEGGLTSEPTEVCDNVDGPHSIDYGVHHKVDEEANDDHRASDIPASMPVFESGNAVELVGDELEDSVPALKGTRFGLDDSGEKEIDDDGEAEVNGKDTELFDYATLAELLRAANLSPGQGKAKVLPVETSESTHPPPTVVSIPESNTASVPVLEVPADPEIEMTEEERKLHRKVNMARVKYLRLIHRLGYDTDHQVPVQILYRFSLVEGYRRLRTANHSSELERAWKRALQLEAEGIEKLDFSCNVLVLGKAGVGKSATINSIFGEDKTETNAFLPATSSINEITGVVDGVNFCVIDTPGLGTSFKDEKSNRKLLKSVKKYMKRCPPDIILYVDRLDTLRQDENSLALLQDISSVLGLSIWSKTIITLTHSAAAPPEGPSGSAMNYEMVVTHRTHAIQESIRRVTNSARINYPTALVENHHLCWRNTEGEKVLPNGLNWRPHLLLLCYSLKMGAEIDSMSTRRAAPASLFGHYFQVPPLPYFLSSLLQSREHPRRANEQNLNSVESDVDPDQLLSDDQGDEEEEDYDQLPPFKPLSISQIAKLTKEQQKLYFDEYEYRTELLQKKQLKEELARFKELKKREGNNHDVPVDDDRLDDDTDRSPLPDWALPCSFDSDDPVYRYRCLQPTRNLLVRAVPSPDGWDHDCGFDGVSLQHNRDVANRFPASVWVQVHKDKREFTIHLDSSMSAKHGDHGSTLVGFDVQTMMDQFAYTLRGETKLKNFKRNSTTGGLSMTFMGDTMITGAKFEDKLLVGNRLALLANTGAVSMRGDTAHGLNMMATLREINHPLGQGLATLGVSLIRWRKEWTLAANLDSQFSVGRTSNMAVHVDVNNKLAGRLSIKANTSEQLKIALLSICSATMYLWNRMHPGPDPHSK